jgi:hypothetical protein
MLFDEDRLVKIDFFSKILINQMKDHMIHQDNQLYVLNDVHQVFVIMVKDFLVDEVVHEVMVNHHH